MQIIPDRDLLDQFARNGSEDAFGELVRRHIALVHSVALRHTDNPHQAKEITQAVFIILARKAASIGQKTILSGWLYHTARLTAANFRRSEFRRIRREQEAFMQSTSEETLPDSAWRELAPLLDEAMARLGATDRDAVVLRYFENKTLSEVGVALGVEERAAQKRVSRAVEKLRTFFLKRGIDSTAGNIAGAISAHSVQAVPVALAKAVTAVAIAKGASASISTLTLINGALKIMAWTKTQTAIVVCVGVLLAVGTTTVTIKEIQEHKTYPWQKNEITEGLINEIDHEPPQVGILPSQFHAPAEHTGEILTGTGLRAIDIVCAAYNYSSPARVVFSAPLKRPADRWDYIASLPGGADANRAALQREIKRKFGVVGRTETREADVLLLKVKSRNAPALKLNRSSSNWNGNLNFRFRNERMFSFAGNLEYFADVPIIDETGLTDRFDFDLNCKQTDVENKNWDNVNQALDQLGLELVPANMPIEMLVVEKAK